MLIWGLLLQALNTLPPCENRPTALAQPLVDSALYCLEHVAQSDTQNALDFTALAAAPDGTLYAASPLNGAVYQLRDSDADGLPNSPILLIDGLDRPNALLYHEGTLYIGTRDAVYQWRESTLTPLIESLPTSALWNGGLTLAEDGRLLIGISKGCDACAATMQRGGVLACSTESGACESFAYGLRQPLGLAWDSIRGGLWVTDASDGIRDEIHFAHGGEHFGYPSCDDVNAPPSSQYDSVLCIDYAKNLIDLPVNSIPAAVAVYQGDAFPQLHGQVLVLLSGSYNQARTTGYALLTLNPDDNALTYLAPYLEPTRGQHTLNEMLQNRGEGFYPHRLYGLTISAEGWIYFSGGGAIYVLRPR